MKHYVLENDQVNLADTAQTTGRVQNIDVILCNSAAKASAEMIVEFYRALNTLIEDHTYVVNLRVPAAEAVGGPLYWAGRSAIFWGDLDRNWTLSGAERAWASQVLSLSSRSVLVGSAVLLLAETGRADQAVAAIHPNFEAAAQERGLSNSGTGTHFASDGRIHSASTRLGALRLLSEFVSWDHGEHLADNLRGYIGLSEPQQKHESQLATRLIHRASGDPLVTRAVDMMLEHIEEPLRIPDLSQRLMTSTRQLQRRFLSRTGAKLLATYRELRLERAHSLLRFTDMQQAEISAATGFASTIALTRAFLDQYGTRPETVRNRRFSGELSRHERTHPCSVS